MLLFDEIFWIDRIKKSYLINILFYPVILSRYFCFISVFTVLFFGGCGVVGFRE